MKIYCFITVCIVNIRAGTLYVCMLAGKMTETDDVSLTGSMISLTSLSAVQKMTTVEVANAELGETEDICKSSLEKLRAAVKADPQLQTCVQKSNDLNLDCLEDVGVRRFFLRFLRVNKYNVAKAKSQLKGYLKMRQAEPLWYTGLGDVENLGGAIELVRF